ncbi:MAG TPA: CPBP family glutamic-type intramembrane protease [Acidimicrobiales bacterium]|nr:CPBP family glutamic-type intramembrane protease [Acidimicrobiales bacterium]
MIPQPSAHPPPPASPLPPPRANPGWYADPWGHAPLRWWDGSRWTAYLHGPYRPQVPPPGYPHPGYPYARYPSRPAVERAPKGPGIKGGGIAAVGAGVGVALSILVTIGFAIDTHGNIDSRNPWFLLVTQLALWVGFVGAVVVASRRNGTGSLAADFGLAWPSWRDVPRGVAGGVIGRTPATVILILVLLAEHGTLSSNSGHQITGITPEGTAGWVVYALLLLGGAPVIEELFFRGLIQGAFTRRVGAVPAIFVTAVIFSFAHVANEGILAPLILFPAAIVLGYLRHHYGRLAPGMIAHSTFNAIAFGLLLAPGLH